MLTDAEWDFYDACVLEVAEEMLTAGVNIARDLYEYTTDGNPLRIPDGVTVSKELLRVQPLLKHGRPATMACVSGELIPQHKPADRPPTTI